MSLRLQTAPFVFSAPLYNHHWHCRETQAWQSQAYGANLKSSERTRAPRQSSPNRLGSNAIVVTYLEPQSPTRPAKDFTLPSVRAPDSNPLKRQK